MSRPDISNYLAHFTSYKFPRTHKSETNPTNAYKHYSPLKRLENILTERKIISSELPWTGKRAVCLTECPWTSLVDHTKQYSPYGIGFKKDFIFKTGGASKKDIFKAFGSIVGMTPQDFYNHMNNAKGNNNDTETHTAIFEELKAVSQKYFTGEE